MPKETAVSRFRSISQDRLQEFTDRGLAERYFFPHRLYYLPKCGPDALRLARDMCGRNSLDGHVELLLFAAPDQLGEFPSEIFFDDDLVWHRQQFGKTGHIAFAYLFRDGNKLYGLNYVSDLVQRISRRREYATRVEKRFHGWRYMLLNGIMNFAVENGIQEIYSPASTLVMANTDRTRTVRKELFERVYDRAVQRWFSATREGEWWVIDVQANRGRLAPPEHCEETLPSRKVICICHDVERGLGHAGIDRERERAADSMAPAALQQMLECEEAAGLKATYNVVGCFFDEVRHEIQARGHSLAFHSYNHVIRKNWRITRHYWRLRRVLASFSGNGVNGEFHDQLYRCRLVDRRVRGFRPPQSRITAEWNDYNLVYRNFEWCAASPRTVAAPLMQNGLAKIPILLDDFPLYKAKMPFDEWEQQLIVAIRNDEFVAFGLHDCYSDFWLRSYERLLKRISELGECKTLDAVADETIFAHAI